MGTDGLIAVIYRHIIPPSYYTRINPQTMQIMIYEQITGRSSVVIGHARQTPASFYKHLDHMINTVLQRNGFIIITIIHEYCITINVFIV